MLKKYNVFKGYGGNNMDSIIEISNLKFSYENNIVFDNLSMEIDRGDFISIVGPNSSGKTTLARLLFGLIESDCICIDGEKLTPQKLSSIRKKIGVVFGESSRNFIFDNVFDDLVFRMENLGYSSLEIDKNLEYVCKLLDIKDLLQKNINDLSGGEKQLVLLANALVLKPSILLLDDALSMIDKNSKKRILSLLLELHDTTDITIVNITNDLEETLFSDKIAIINNGTIVTKGYTNDVLLEEKVIKSNGLDLPFVTDLSINLKYYNLVDELIPTLDEMVVRLWQ